MTSILAALLALVACDTPPGPKDVVDLVPVDNEISGWTRSAAMKLAENQTQLYDLIDGEAQPYLDNGFVKCAFQNFKGDIGGNQVELELRVFDMGDSTHAKSLYDALAVGGETPWNSGNAGREARIDENLLFAYKIDFHQDKFYVWTTVQEKSDPALEIAKTFCLNVDAAMEE